MQTTTTSAINCHENFHLESKPNRVILHLDLDCFYAQVESVSLNIPPEQPLAVQQWGSLLAINYPARKFGITRGDNITEARKKCPAIHLPHVQTIGDLPDKSKTFNRRTQKAILQRYRNASKLIFSIFEKHSKICERASIDEAYMDVTEEAISLLGTLKNSDFESQVSILNDQKTIIYGFNDEHSHGGMKYKFPVNKVEELLLMGALIAKNIRDEVFQELKYTVSAGISINKLVAKLASPLNKPDGQMVYTIKAISSYRFFKYISKVVAPRFLAMLMNDFPVQDIGGLGGKLGEQVVKELKITEPCSVVADSNYDKKSVRVGKILENYSLQDFQKKLGNVTGTHVYNMCCGDDGDEPVVSEKRLVKSISSIKNFRDHDYLKSISELIYFIKLLCQELYERIMEERVDTNRIPSGIAIYLVNAITKKVSTFRKQLDPNLFLSSKIDYGKLFSCVVDGLQKHFVSALPISNVTLTVKPLVPVVESGETITHFFDKASKLERNQILESTSSCQNEDVKKSGFQKSVYERKKVPREVFNESNYECRRCRKVILKESKEEHDDYHFAEDLQTEWVDSTSSVRHEGDRSLNGNAKRQKCKGPMDYFVHKS